MAPRAVRAFGRVFALFLVLSLCLSLAAIEKEPLQEYKSRREHVAVKANGGVIVLFGAPSKDLVKFQQEENFYYLTGFDEPDAIMLIDTSAPPNKEYLFLKARDLSQEQWTGVKLGPGSEAEKVTGMQTVKPIAEFPELLKKTSANKQVYTLKADYGRIREIISGGQLEDITPAIAELRQVKSATELALLDKAVQITLKGHEAAARTIAPNVMEYEVQAALEYEFRRSGAEGPGYPSIVGSGPFSTILHYDKGTRRMEAGDVVVVDVGAEYSGYSADITRTYPVSGKFSARQKEIYQIVLDAQKAAIAEIKPGTTFAKIHAAAYDYIRSKGYARYFIHGTSHHIGLQVHDVGRTARPMEPNMVITVEPGIYIPEEKIGVRIEDDVVVTPSGCRVLSNFPKEITEVEALVQKKP
jgi:Xaa-Pro aminopeptidase